MASKQLKDVRPIIDAILKERERMPVTDAEGNPFRYGEAFRSGLRTALSIIEQAPVESTDPFFDGTNAEVLGRALLVFDGMEPEVQEHVADYIGCCNGPECFFDGKDTSLCIPCKVRWLQEKWEG